jgi:hypothetical protein
MTFTRGMKFLHWYTMKLSCWCDSEILKIDTLSPEEYNRVGGGFSPTYIFGSLGPND